MHLYAYFDHMFYECDYLVVLDNFTLSHTFLQD